MSLRVYDYLRTQLNTAFIKAFSTLTTVPDIPILFTTITPDLTTDIATPFPLKISQALNIPVSTVSAHLLNDFSFDNNYLSNNSKDLYHNGFFNFKLSSRFLLHSVYVAANSDPEAIDRDTSNYPILEKIRILLENSVPEKIPAIEYFTSIPNFFGDHERNALRLIGISNCDAVHSESAGFYFIKRLIDEVQDFYRKCPLRTPDTELNLFRFFIAKALYNRIMMLNTLLNDITCQNKNTNAI
jgi:hypothetical protein